jgi:uncharacterized protein YndB with AHSA1/START domain
MNTTSPELISTRLFDASCEELFAAFSDPRRLTLWWGPKGFRNTFREFDLRPGGKWLFTMHGPDGKEYPNEKEFTEVIPNERVVFRHISPTHGFWMTITFAPEEGKARLTWQMVFDSELEEGVREFILNANEENFDRLEADLKQNPA